MAGRDDDARWRILEAYSRAKQVDPTITRGEFMRRGAPGAHLPKTPGKFKDDESAARYFRKIVSGERTGGAMYRAGREKGNIGLFQIRGKLGDRFISQNIMVAGGSLDVRYPRDRARTPYDTTERHGEVIDKHRAKYGMEDADVEDLLRELEVRTIHHQNRPIRMRLSIS